VIINTNIADLFSFHKIFFEGKKHKNRIKAL